MSSLPTFLIIGAAKSGTTSLYRYLGEHPDVYMSPLKEPHFFAFEDQTLSFSGPGDSYFNTHSITSLEAYRHLFDDAEVPVCGEASVTSLYHPQAVDRVAHYIPGAHLVAILRDPIDRAYSHFLMLIKQGLEPHPDFATALEEEFHRLDAGWSFIWDYTGFGFYYEQLSRYTERFPPEQIHVYLFRDLVERPLETVQDIFRLLGVDDTFEPSVEVRHNASGIPRLKPLHWLLYHANVRGVVRDLLPDPVVQFVSSRFPGSLRTINRWKNAVMHRNMRRPPLPDEVRADLRDLYREDILRLQELIDRDLSPWLED